MRTRIINPSRFQIPNDPVVIEYDSRGKRVTKTFSSAYAARRFWMEKDKAGKNPKVIKSTEGK
jgi:hypothetical protein